MSSTSKQETDMPLRPAGTNAKPKATSSDQANAIGQKKNAVSASQQDKDVVRKKPLTTVRKKSASSYPSTGSVKVTVDSPQPAAPAPVASMPTNGPLHVKKVKPLREMQPFLEDLRKASTSSTASTVSSASLASTATSYSTASTKSTKSTASVRSTATIRPTTTAKPKVVPKTAVTKPEEQPRVPSAVVAKPVAGKPGPAPCKTTANIPTTAMASVEGEKQDLPKKKKPLKKKRPAKTSGPEIAQVSEPAPTLSVKAPKAMPDVSIPPTQVVTNPAVPKLKALKKGAPSVSKIISSASDASSLTGSGREKAKIPSSVPDKQNTEPPKTPAKKPKSTTSEGTVKKVKASSAAIQASRIASAASRTSAASKPAASKTAAQPKAKAPTSSSTTTTVTKTAPKRIVSAPLAIPPTPRSARKVKAPPRASTPPPAITRRPQTERPLTRRKSVSFKSPLEIFQIIPNRRASTPPPVSSGKSWSAAQLKKVNVPVVTEQEVDELKTETVPPPPPSSITEDDHFVFEEGDDVYDRLVLGLSVAAELEEPESAKEDDAKTLADTPEVSENRTDEAPVEEATDAPAPPLEPIQEAVDEPAFEPEAQTEPDEDDESTIFYDVDESYIPQYSSPRKPGTPRTGLASTPGSARAQMAKMSKSPKLDDSPKLDLLRLNSPTKKKRKKVSAVADEARVDGNEGLGIPLAVKLETTVF